GGILIYAITYLTERIETFVLFRDAGSCDFVVSSSTLRSRPRNNTKKNETTRTYNRIKFNFSLYRLRELIVERRRFHEPETATRHDGGYTGAPKTDSRIGRQSQQRVLYVSANRERIDSHLRR